MAPPASTFFTQRRCQPHLHPNWADLRRRSPNTTTDSIRPSPRFTSNHPSTLPRPAAQPVPRVRLALRCLRLNLNAATKAHATSRQQLEMLNRWASLNHRAPRPESIYGQIGLWAVMPR